MRMANPQKENGYTPVANEIIDKISNQLLNGTQFRILLIVWRYTYGFSRKEHDLSETFISKATGIHKKQVQRELVELIKLKILSVEKQATFSTPRIISFNKDYESWEVTKKIPGSILEDTTKKIPGNELDTQTGSGLATSTGSGLATQDKQYKTNNKTNIAQAKIEELFDSIWKLYPNKKGKASVKTKQREILYKIGYDELKRCIERYKESKEDWKAWKDGSTFFNSGYVDYLDENYSETEQENFGIMLEGGGVML